MKTNLNDLPEYTRMNPEDRRLQSRQSYRRKPIARPRRALPAESARPGADRSPIRLFSNPEFGDVRTLETPDGKILFCGSDVAKALGYSNKFDAVTRHCRCIVKHDTPHPQAPDKTIEMSFITEGDVYRLISHSKLPDAERFESWVFDEVLPSIRRHGAYMTSEVAERTRMNPDYIVKILEEMKAGRERYSHIELELVEMRNQLQHQMAEYVRLIEMQAKTINRQKEQLALAEPKVKFVDAVMDSEDENLIKISVLAKLIASHGIDIGGRRLFEYLRARRYLLSSKEHWNQPTQQSMNLGLFSVKEKENHDRRGRMVTNIEVRVTPKGQQYFLNHFLDMQKNGVDYTDYLPKKAAKSDDE